jgi:hypothetical protein
MEFEKLQGRNTQDLEGGKVQKKELWYNCLGQSEKAYWKVSHSGETWWNLINTMTGKF